MRYKGNCSKHISCSPSLRILSSSQRMMLIPFPSILVRSNLQLEAQKFCGWKSSVSQTPKARHTKSLRCSRYHASACWTMRQCLVKSRTEMLGLVRSYSVKALGLHYGRGEPRSQDIQGEVWNSCFSRTTKIRNTKSLLSFRFDRDQVMPLHARP